MKKLRENNKKIERYLLKKCVGEENRKTAKELSEILNITGKKITDVLYLKGTVTKRLYKQGLFVRNSRNLKGIAGYYIVRPDHGRDFFGPEHSDANYVINHFRAFKNLWRIVDLKELTKEEKLSIEKQQRAIMIAIFGGDSNGN